MASAFQFIREYRLETPGHSRGVSCGRDGPTLGLVPLLAKTEADFSLRPVEELNEAFTQIFARPMDCHRLLPGLRVVARALNQRDLALAMIATTQLRLPTLSEDEARRAAVAVQFEKASPDDPDHPGWPKGTPGGLGEKFRPKEEAGGALQRTRRKKTEAELLQLTQRALIREALLRVLSPLRAARLLGEAATNAVPGLNVAADIAVAAEIAAMAADFAKLKIEADAALEFIAKGPYSSTNCSSILRIGPSLPLMRSRRRSWASSTGRRGLVINIITSSSRSRVARFRRRCSIHR
ncbi:MAG TPA: hypothetical protein VMJ31_04805 [Methylocystis sp.]|nr:hypothetical protein [Methylocystis sp.]